MNVDGFDKMLKYLRVTKAVVAAVHHRNWDHGVHHMQAQGIEAEESSGMGVSINSHISCLEVPIRRISPARYLYGQALDDSF